MTIRKPIANPVVVLREEFDDWAVLFNPDTADAVGISPVGVMVWRLLDGQRSLSDITGVITDCFSNVPENVEEDVAGYIDDLMERGYVGFINE